jgi:hypothetical protein
MTSPTDFTALVPAGQRDIPLCDVLAQILDQAIRHPAESAAADLAWDLRGAGHDTFAVTAGRLEADIAVLRGLAVRLAAEITAHDTGTAATAPSAAIEAGTGPAAR